MEIKEVLEWYANENNWKPRGDSFDPKPPLVAEDKGNLAREALAAHFSAKAKKPKTKKVFKVTAEKVKLKPDKINEEDKFKTDYQTPTENGKKRSVSVAEEPYFNTYKPGKDECILDAKIDKKLNKKLNIGNKSYRDKPQYEKECPFCRVVTDISNFHTSFGEKNTTSICNNCYRLGKANNAD